MSQSSQANDHDHIVEANLLLTQILQAQENLSQQSNLSVKIEKLTDDLEKFFKDATPYKDDKAVVNTSALIDIYEQIKEILGKLSATHRLGVVDQLSIVSSLLSAGLGETKRTYSTSQPGIIHSLSYPTLSGNYEMNLEELFELPMYQRAEVLSGEVNFLDEAGQKVGLKQGLKQLLEDTRLTEAEFISQSKRSFLLVDDDPLIIEAVRRKLIHLRSDPHVVTCSSGQECLDVLQSKIPQKRAPKPRLVFLDLTMPGLNGIEVLERIRGISTIADTQVIVLTAHPDPYFHERVKEIGCGGVVSKNKITSCLKILSNYIDRFSKLDD